MNKEREKYLIDFGRRLKMARKAKNMTLQELADAVGYTNRSTIATIEAGKQDITASKLQAIARVLEVSPYYLQFGEDEPRELIIERHNISDISDIEKRLLTYFRRLSDSEKEAIVNILKKGD